MFLHHLSISNFRNYLRLELELASPIALFQGNNGQGKTNLLEAVYFLATTRSPRAGSDRELIHWAAYDEPIPFARVAGTVRKGRSDLKVEIVVRADRAARSGSTVGEEGGAPSELSKRIKVNGVARRALELIGLIKVVMFSPQELELVAGAPALRRRYLDIANCQVEPRYCRALQQYNRVLNQRNHLLKQIRDGREPPETLEFWSEELVKSGSYLLSRRQDSIAALNGRIGLYHRRLTGTDVGLRIIYRSAVAEALGRTGEAETRGRGDGETGGRGDGESTEHSEPSTQDSALGTQDSAPDLAEAFRRALRRIQRREVMQGVTLLGPHRDDLVFQADGIDMNVYGSRGEQRTVALALKLSEVEFMRAATAEQPILLLDDVMSELDPDRRQLLLETLGTAGQILMTATDLHPFSPEFLSGVSLFSIDRGSVRPLQGA